jgi:hypothetical protein
MSPVPMASACSAKLSIRANRTILCRQVLKFGLQIVKITKLNCKLEIANWKLQIGNCKLEIANFKLILKVKNKCNFEIKSKVQSSKFKFKM